MSYSNNRPKKGSTIKVEPIRDRQKIAQIKRALQSRPRDLCFFVMGINTGFRANELLSIKVGQVKYLKPGFSFEVKQKKTHKHRRVTMNSAVYKATQNWILVSNLDDDDYLFQGRKGVLTVPTVSRMVKKWCGNVGLNSGNYASHTMRKTWGFWQYKNGVPIPLLMTAYGHATQQQTLGYLCIQDTEIAKIYELEL